MSTRKQNRKTMRAILKMRMEDVVSKETSICLSKMLDNSEFAEGLSQTHRYRNAQLFAPFDVKRESGRKAVSFNQEITITYIIPGVVRILDQKDCEPTRFQHEMHEYMAAEALDTLLKFTLMPEKEFFNQVVGTDPLIRSSARDQLLDLRRRAMAIRSTPSLDEDWFKARDGPMWSEAKEAEFQDLLFNQQSRTLFPIVRASRNTCGYTVDEGMLELMDHLLSMF